MHGIADDILSRLSAMDGLNAPHLTIRDQIQAQAYDISAFKIAADELMAGAPGRRVVVLAAGFSVPYYIWDPTFDALADAGFLRAIVPREHGGASDGIASGIRPLAEIQRALGRGDSSVALVSSMHPSVLAFWAAAPRPPAEVAEAWEAQLEQIKIIGPLTDPTAYGGRAEDALELDQREHTRWRLERPHRGHPDKDGGRSARRGDRLGSARLLANIDSGIGQLCGHSHISLDESPPQQRAVLRANCSEKLPQTEFVHKREQCGNQKRLWRITS